MSEPNIKGNDLGIRQSNSWGEGLGAKIDQPITKVFEMDYKENKVDYTGEGKWISGIMSLSYRVPLDAL